MLRTFTQPGGRVAQIGKITPVEATIAVAATSTTVLAASDTRAYAIFINNSDTDIYLSDDGGAAALNAGVLLVAGGGHYEMGATWGNLSLLIVKAIHGGSGTKSLLVKSG
jgi:hypothetical protein